jgi:hypothetical protein
MDSRIEIQRLTNSRLLQDDLERELTNRKIEAHQERINCIEKLFRIEDLLGKLGPRL